MTISEKVRIGTLTREDLKHLSSGDDINRPEDGNTPLGYAVLSGDIATIRLLLEHHASVSRRADNGLTVLHMAVDAKKNAARVVKILLAIPGIEVDAEDETYPYDTPLKRSLKNNPDIAIVEALKKAGASATTPNSNGESALDLADRLVNHKIKDVLVDKDDNEGPTTTLTRFIVSAIFLLLDYLKPRPRAVGAIVDAIKMLFNELVKPAIAPKFPEYPKTRADLQLVLDDVIATQGLETMFPPTGSMYEAILTKAFTVASGPGLVSPLTLTEVKTAILLALYQPVIYCDDSGSMKDHGRWAAQADIVKFMAELMLMFSPDDKGVHLRFINKDGGGLDGLKGDALKDKMNFSPDGWTALGTSLNSKVLEPFVYSKITAGEDFERPFFVVVITDGMPTKEDVGTLSSAIGTCREKVSAASYPFYTAKFSVNQIGNDASATKFLDQLQSQSQQPEFHNILHVTSDKLDAKYDQLRENKQGLRSWLRDVLTLPLGSI